MLLSASAQPWEVVGGVAGMEGAASKQREGKKRKKKEGEGGESSLALYANPEDFRASMSHD